MRRFLARDSTNAGLIANLNSEKGPVCFHGVCLPGKIAGHPLYLFLVPILGVVQTAILDSLAVRGAACGSQDPAQHPQVGCLPTLARMDRARARA